MHKLSDQAYEAARHVQALADSLYAEHADLVADESSTLDQRVASWTRYQAAARAAEASRRLYVRLSRVKP